MTRSQVWMVFCFLIYFTIFLQNQQYSISAAPVWIFRQINKAFFCNFLGETQTFKLINCLIKIIYSTIWLIWCAKFGRPSVIIEDCGFRDFGPNSGWDYRLATPRRYQRILNSSSRILRRNLCQTIEHEFFFVGQV